MSFKGRPAFFPQAFIVHRDSTQMSKYTLKSEVSKSRVNLISLAARVDKLAICCALFFIKFIHR